MEAATDLPNPATVLVVDDGADNLALMSDLLGEKYTVKVANNGERALRIAAVPPHPDLILLDVMMPGMDGYAVCRHLKAADETRNIPVIFLTARSEEHDEELGLAIGAVDYLTKPIRPSIMLARVATHLNLKASADFLHDKNAFLEQEVARRTQEISAIQDVMIQVLASLAETRDCDTGNHIRRTQFYVKALAEELRGHARFGFFLTEYNINMLFRSAPLHDIGKVGVPDRILLKPGHLDAAEFDIMKTHAILGHQAIEQAERVLGSRVEFLSMAKDIALYHHEKWDGSGYPEGLRGEAIPIAARLMALADVYDAMTSRRIYKEPMPHESAVAIVQKERGRHFDPDVADAFLARQDVFLAISRRFADTDQDLAVKKEFIEKAI